MRAPFFAAGRAPYPLPCVHARCRAFTSAGAVAAWGERWAAIEVRYLSEARASRRRQGRRRIEILKAVGLDVCCAS